MALISEYLAADALGRINIRYWVKIYTSMGGWWVGVWEEKWRLKLTSAEVEVEADLGNYV